MKTKYSVDIKLQVVREYKKGIFGYKRLAHKYNLSRDVVRAWCLDFKKLIGAFEMSKSKKI